VLFLKDNDSKDIEKLNEFIDSIEKQIDDIKDSNQFVIPETIRYRYPQLYSAEYYSAEVKKVRNQEKVLRNRLLIVYGQLEEKKAPNEELENTKRELLEEVVRIHEKYLKIDDSMNKEIDEYITKTKRFGRGGCCNFLKT
jgi:septum formation topological specificity factor MinE